MSVRLKPVATAASAQPKQRLRLDEVLAAGLHVTKQRASAPTGAPPGPGGRWIAAPGLLAVMLGVDLVGEAYTRMKENLGHRKLLNLIRAFDAFHDETTDTTYKLAELKAKMPTESLVQMIDLRLTNLLRYLGWRPHYEQQARLAAPRGITVEKLKSVPQNLAFLNHVYNVWVDEASTFLPEDSELFRKLQNARGFEITVFEGRWGSKESWLLSVLWFLQVDLFVISFLSDPTFQANLTQVGLSNMGKLVDLYFWEQTRMEMQFPGKLQGTEHVLGRKWYANRGWYGGGFFDLLAKLLLELRTEDLAPEDVLPQQEVASL